MAVHHGGPPVEPDAEYAPDAAAIELLQAAVARWLPAAALVEIDVCPYDNTADEAFVVERRDGLVIGAGTSGHAFKFGPLLGAQLAGLVRDGQ
jgi:sarcosine oxidase